MTNLFCRAALGTAAHGAHGSVQGFFWFLTIARGITGVVSLSYIRGNSNWKLFLQGVGGEYPASSTSASEAANEQMVKYRGPSNRYRIY